MSLVPLGHRLLIKPQKLEDVDQAYKAARSAGIIIQESHEKLQQAAVDKGTVVAMGETAFKDFGGNPWCFVGDLVAYARYGGKLITDPETEENYLILNDEDVICKIVKD
jgi:co-chaperonin GroES (HSP10)